MKTLSLICCVLLILPFSLLVGGCASAGAGKGAYPTLKQTQMQVDWPMTRYHNAVAAGGVTLGEQQRVNDAYKSYRQAYDAALQAAHSNDEAATPENVKTLANHVIDAIAAIPF